ncbi:SDR family NAD(P)-dependent oxidoreductase [Sphingomonas sp. SUN019]|uniref:SDR family NAD(P)-dependent oxidoreductase n=1 Tax=Sphingomonas sp. SUN019 TaxID=2937788 RepID=UPI002164A328|nr:SDR family NAD(P)-dependent oxidoreductase [Sphingomonas sp. SUN019]UVO49149.1 SDR family NAD(P)-dependent oxidoreductase [Sphingomonas sp. SUN019]
MSGAIVIGASGGIGKALVEALIEEERAVRGFARSFAGADHIDLEDEASIAAAAARSGSPDLVIVATGLLHEGENGPEKALRDLDPAWLARIFAINTIGPALIAKHFLPVMPKTGRCVFAVLSARVGSITDNRLGGWHGYRASKAALNQIIRTIAIEEKRRNDRLIVVGLHPGTVDTALSKPFQRSGRDLFAADRAAVQLLDVIDDLKAADSGKVFAWDGAEVPA